MDTIAVVIEKKLGLSLQIKLVPEQDLIEQLFLDRSDCSLYEGPLAQIDDARHDGPRRCVP